MKLVSIYPYVLVKLMGTLIINEGRIMDAYPRRAPALCAYAIVGFLIAMDDD